MHFAYASKCVTHLIEYYILFCWIFLKCILKGEHRNEIHRAEFKRKTKQKMCVCVCVQRLIRLLDRCCSLFVRSSPMIMICMHAQWCASTFKYGAHLGILQIRIKCIHNNVYIYSLSFTCLLRITFGLLKWNIYFWLSHFSIGFGIGSGQLQDQTYTRSVWVAHVQC